MSCAKMRLPEDPPRGRGDPQPSLVVINLPVPVEAQHLVYIEIYLLSKKGIKRDLAHYLCPLY